MVCWVALAFLGLYAGLLLVWSCLDPLANLLDKADIVLLLLLGIGE
jgi:hypothetical protein